MVYLIQFSISMCNLKKFQKFICQFDFFFLFLFKEKRNLSSPDKDLEPNSKMARCDDQDKDHTEEQQISANGEIGERRVSEVPTDSSGSGLEDDLLLSESDETTFDAYEIVKSMSSTSCITLKKRTLPVPRKPDYVPAPYYFSDDENESPNKNLAASKNFSTGGKKKRGSILSPVLSENSNKIDGKNTKRVKIEKRSMYIRINQTQLDGYHIGFLQGDEKIVRKTISDMCHSLRFWLAIKFCAQLSSEKGMKKLGVLTQAKVCNFLGIPYDSFNSIRRKIGSKTFTDFDGLSPLEYSCLNKRTHANKIEELASNLDDPLVQHVISVKK